ncbi:MAG TPA: tetratricopeptide repeat protein [Cyclobacteriaceae bacterium]|nr:tetratricopeptide repeat protein [Cyclobacteriaceae bacterium]
MKLPGYLLFIFCIIPGWIPGHAQVSIYSDKVVTCKVDTVLHHIYNLEFEKASENIAEIESAIGPHPAVLLLKAQFIYWKYRPLVKDTKPYWEYEALLKKVIIEAENNFNNPGLEMEKNFYMMSGYSLLTEQYSEDKDYWKVLSTAKNAYSYLRDGMGHEEELPDYFFSTGLYNYYRVKYPELYPFYKPFLWFFIEGNKDTGIEQLKEASERSLFLKEQAYIYLFHIYLRYENNPSAAFPYARYLAETFPDNHRFMTLYTEALIRQNDFSTAAPYAKILSGRENKLYSIPGYLFMGMIAEHNNNPAEARRYYHYSLSMADDNEGEDDHFVGMSYAGLARLKLKENDITAAREYYKLAYKTEPYIPVKSEANAFFEKYD